MLRLLLLVAAVFHVSCVFRYRFARSDLRHVIFALVASFRSVLPRLDAERACYVDVGWLSSPFVGRCAATAAEISFGFIVTAAVKRAGGHDSSRLFTVLGSLTILAQLFCWRGVATRCQIWNALEETTWAVFALLTVVCMLRRICLHAAAATDYKVAAMVMTAYLVYLVVVDIPMYARRAMASPDECRPFLEGVAEMLRCEHVTTDMSFWAEDFIWMVGYFLCGPCVTLWAAYRLQ